MTATCEGGALSLRSEGEHALARRLLRGLLSLLYRVRVDGIEHIPRTGPVVIASNHPSYLDPPTLYVSLPRPVRFMAWDALFKNPLMARFITRLGAFPVDCQWSAPSSVKTALAILGESGVLGIFPEGRRTRKPPLDPFKRGAIRLACQTGATIVPVTIRGSERIWPYGQKFPRMRGRIRVMVHPPIAPPDRDDPDAQRELLARLREAISSGL